MFENFKEFNLPSAKDVTIHGIQSNSSNGPPLLLLHGFPQTHHIWHRITSSLISHFTVIALDLRGYGKSSKPPSSAKENHKPYSKSVMAADCVAVMSSLGFEKFSICSHDRGARVAHKLCVDFPEKVEKVMFLDIAPTLAMFEATDMNLANKYFHWFFMLQPEPFPEELMYRNVDLFSQRFFGGGYSAGGGFFKKEEMGEYMKLFEEMECVHGMCEDYRAAATIDLEEARKDKVEGKKVKCPVRVLVGGKGVVAKMDYLGMWREVCEKDVSGDVVDSGHYIPEEVPDVLLKNIMDFFV
ncbi:Alpha/Beta hydrolase protein [Tricladium varicosporioides]|nr:Alpha/Beta hydrolase protein [Hymenoscyphus varicosporioides]